MVVDQTKKKCNKTTKNYWFMLVDKISINPFSSNKDPCNKLQFFVRCL